MNLYDQMDNERAGQEAKINALAERRAEEIAVQQLRDAELEKRAALVEERRQNENANMAYSQGEEEGFVTGLGMDQQTGLGLMQQQVQEREQASQGAAMQIIQEVEAAQAQGAPAEQIQKMISSIPPELRGVVQQINMAKRQDQGQAQRPPDKQVSPANASANAILMENSNLVK